MEWDGKICAFLLVTGLLSRVALLCYPNQVVFDEFHFGKFVNGYLKGEYFFDIHPPLGKLLLALVAWLGGYKGEQSWDKIGDPISPEVNLFALRIGPALQGALLSPAMYVAGRKLGLSRPAALLAGAGVLLDICTLVEQRLVLTDATLLLGISLQLVGSFASDWQSPLSRAWLSCLATAGGGIAIAVSTKWTGAASIGVAGVHSLVALVRRWARGDRLRSLSLDATARLLLLLLLPALVYVGTFAAHLAFLSTTGPGAKFMTPRFRATLSGDAHTLASIGARGISPPSLVERIRELHAEMFRANKSIKTEHKWGSRWWEWPLMLRSVLYWTGKEPPYILPPERRFARIYCIGTPFVWWLAAAGPTLLVGWAVAMLIAPRLLPAHMTSSMPEGRLAAPTAKEEEKLDAASSAADEGSPPPQASAPPAVAGAAHGASKANHGDATGAGRALGPPTFVCNGSLLALAYLLNWLPFVLVERVAFIYHFLPSLMHSLLLAGLMFDVLVPRVPLLLGRTHAQADDDIGSVGRQVASSPESLRWLVSGVLVCLMAGCFGFFAPLAYGMPISEAELDSRMWMETWR